MTDGLHDRQSEPDGCQQYPRRTLSLNMVNYPIPHHFSPSSGSALHLFTALSPLSAAHPLVILRNSHGDCRAKTNEKGTRSADVAEAPGSPRPAIALRTCSSISVSKRWTKGRFVAFSRLFFSVVNRPGQVQSDPGMCNCRDAPLSAFAQRVARNPFCHPPSKPSAHHSASLSALPRPVVAGRRHSGYPAKQDNCAVTRPCFENPPVFSRLQPDCCAVTIRMVARLRPAVQSSPESRWQNIMKWNNTVDQPIRRR
ncbi:hypothetical protein NL676_036906 [Syzygium grande]|nr:hypothetical protein NL676_036906 [Syzygium grande]